MISVLDYGSGNIQSVIRMLEKAGGRAQRISTPEEVLKAEALVLPGVGAYDYGMRQLAHRELIPALNAVAGNGQVSVLGICLGMQLMCRSSEEGTLAGLGWLDALVQRFADPRDTGLTVPHMGWNTLNVVRDNPLLPTEGEEQRFYFVHSYRVHCNEAADVVALCDYGGSFVAAFQKGNLFGAQFHPEKSHRFGLAMMRRFVESSRVEA